MDLLDEPRAKRQRRAPSRLAGTDFEPLPSHRVTPPASVRSRPTPQASGTVGAVLERECLPRSRQLSDRDTRGALLKRLPAALQERQVALQHLKTFDKAFSCEWLDERTIAFGTKDDKITVLDAETLTPRKVVKLPLSAPRLDASEDYLVATNCGIRGMAVSPSKELLAAGGCGPNDCAILSLPDCRPVQRLKAHSDWVFGVAWITDRLIATGSRDHTVKLWQLDTDVADGRTATHTAPRTTSSHHKAKVRDVKWNDTRKELATLSTGCQLGLWDAQLGHMRDVKLPEGRSGELCCLAVSESLMAAGSVSHVHMMDPRNHRSTAALSSLDAQEGVRSLRFQHGLLSIGTGRGHVFFYDIRAGKYLEEPVGRSSARPTTLEMSVGWLNCNAVYTDYFAGQRIWNAAYGQAWDPGGTRLFVCGGPLATGLQGSYMAMWH